MGTGAARNAGDLSPRELQLLSLAAQGFTDQAISHKLAISLGTIGTYWGRIRIKFGPLNRTELVANWLKLQATATLDELMLDNRRLLSEVRTHAMREQMLQATLDGLRQLIDPPPDAILIVNGEGKICLANALAEKMFGYEPGALEGSLIEDLVPPEVRDKHTTNRNEYTQNPVRRQMNDHLATEGLRKDGSRFPVAAMLSASDGPSGVLVTCLLRNLGQHLDSVASAAIVDEDQ